MDSEALKLAVESLDGDFELVRELGRGATSIVYLLRDHGLERDVAMKVIRGGLGTEEEALGRLQREAQLVAKLQHPNIVRLFGTQRLLDGSFALLMEHVPGRNLKEILTREGPPPIPRVLEVLKDVGSALAYAHRRKIVHRDVKPENIYIDEEVGAARLADFGVARPWDQDSRLTIPGASLGTPAYMSPEQIDGKVVDGRSDVYSLGLVGYEMVLGHHPWEGENVFTTIFKQKNETLSLELPGLDRYPTLANILGKALEKDPSERWESADVFLAQLQTVTPTRRKGDPSARPGRHRSDGATVPPQAETSPETQATGTPPAPTKEREASSIDWSVLQDDPKLAPTALQSTREDGTPSPAGQTPLAFARKKPFRGLWIAVALILTAGSYGIYRWVLSPSQTPFLTNGSGMATSPFVTGPGGTPSTNSRDPSPLLVLSGGNIQSPVGSETTLALKASGPDGMALIDTLVSFEVVEGEGTLEASEVRTTEGGLAETILRLSTRTGLVVVRGSVVGIPGAETVFRVSAEPGPPTEVTAILGEGQTAPPGEALPEFIGIRVWDQFGNLIPNAEVQFRVLEGGGRVQPRATNTDDVGRAFARWTLGDSAGLQTMAAVVPGAPDTLTVFQATAEMPEEPEPTEEEVRAPEPSVETPRVEEDIRPAAPPAPPAARVRPARFAVGGSHICALAGSAVWCRGTANRGQGSQNPAEPFRALSAGVSHSCGLEANGKAWCWGANESGQLGDASTLDRPSPVEVLTESTFSVLAAGLSPTCGLDGAGAPFCWGRNLNGQLGNGSRADRGQPTPVSGGRTFETLTSGWNHACGLTSTGRAYCWGLNGNGQIGDGTRVDRLVPTPISGTFQALAAGATHTCGISGRTVLCWGENGFGQVGEAASPSGQTVPVPVEGLPSDPVSLALGAVHSCAILRDGSTYCWGQNLHGQLGNGTTESSATPKEVAGGFRFVRIFAGGAMTCGFPDDGSEFCWGMNQGGQLGDGSRTNRTTPVRVSGQ